LNHCATDSTQLALSCQVKLTFGGQDYCVAPVVAASAPGSPFPGTRSRLRAAIPVADLLQPDMTVLVKTRGMAASPDEWPRGRQRGYPFDLFPTDLNWPDAPTALVNGVPQGIHAADVALIPVALSLGAGPISDALEGTVLNPINLIP
jgi:hypothetical protein